MTRSQLEAVYDALAELIGGWNSAAADEDRGPSNDAICITLWDDGSGRIGRRIWGTSAVEDWHDFDDFAGLLKVLEGEGVEIEGEDIT